MFFYYEGWAALFPVAEGISEITLDWELPHRHATAAPVTGNVDRLFLCHSCLTMKKLNQDLSPRVGPNFPQSPLLVLSRL